MNLYYRPDNRPGRQSCSRPNCPAGPYAHTIGDLPDGRVAYESAHASHGRVFHRCTAGRLITELGPVDLAERLRHPALHALAGDARRALENHLAAGGGTTATALEAALAVPDRTAVTAFAYNRGELDS